MAIGFPKPRPRLLEKRDAKAKVRDIDREEREKCHKRSGGQCEVKTLTPNNWNPTHSFTLLRCRQRAGENHHLVSGIGRRNRGKSILAAHRLDVCKVCHAEITNHVLVPCVERDKAEAAATVRYERKR